MIARTSPSALRATTLPESGAKISVTALTNSTLPNASSASSWVHSRKTEGSRFCLPRVAGPEDGQSDRRRAEDQRRLWARRARSGWEADGTWARLLEHAQVRDDAVGRIEWAVLVDSTINRAHQYAAGARKKGSLAGTNWRIRNARRRGRLSADPEEG